MQKKTPTPLRVGRLRIIKGEIVTDPAEIAAMEKLSKRLRKTRRGNGASKRSSA